MKEVNITITSKFIKSIIFGLICSILLSLILHLFSKVGYNASENNFDIVGKYKGSGCQNSILNWYQLTCPLNSKHRFEPDGINVCDAIDMQYSFNSNRISAILKSFLSQHIFFLMAMGLVFGLFYYYKNSIKIRYKK